MATARMSSPLPSPAAAETSPAAGPTAAVPGPTAPAAAGLLAVGQGHAIRWEQSGDPDGLPLLVLHGGPGSGHSAALTRAADPAHWRITGFDQRGCGSSRPRAGLAHNTTWDLVEDIETLRLHLGVRRWLVLGGSWGGTLALAYAGRHPAAVSGLLLRGLFVPTAQELDWFFGGARAVAPAAWDALAGLAPPARRAALLPWLDEVFRGGDAALQAAVARAWAGWEQALEGQPAPLLDGAALQSLCDRYRLQCHYLLHGCWLDGAGAAWFRPEALRGLPVRFLHGSLDRVCRPQAARAVQRRLPGSVFQAVPGAGHGPFHPAMAAAMAQALAHYAAHGDFPPPALADRPAPASEPAAGGVALQEAHQAREAQDAQGVLRP